MDSDDLPRGYLLSRREALAVLGATGMMAFFGCSSAAQATGTSSSDPSTDASGCVVRPELTEGPYYVDEELNRSDIRIDPSDASVREGALLTLGFSVSRLSSGSCTPLEGAVVDVWHCDALGVYSDVSDPGFNTVGRKFLRGYQLTDANGAAQFTTIYPGWYQGRTVHIHFKVRSEPGATSGYEFTSQLFFNDTLTDQVHAQLPYSAKGQRTLRNAGDGIYNQGGSQMVLNVTQDTQGYAATFDLALQV